MPRHSPVVPLPTMDMLTLLQEKLTGGLFDQPIAVSRRALVMLAACTEVFLADEGDALPPRVQVMARAALIQGQTAIAGPAVRFKKDTDIPASGSGR